MAHVLIIDDQKTGREIAEINLTAAAHTFASFATFKEVVEAVKNHNMSFDIIMCHTAGFRDLIDTGVQGTALEGVPIIVQSGDVWEGKLEELRAQGASAFLPKPYSPEKMYECIDRVLVRG